jgi:hypothetical protein
MMRRGERDAGMCLKNKDGSAMNYPKGYRSFDDEIKEMLGGKV